MNRRGFIAVSLAGIVAAGIEYEWIVVADCKTNLNGRRYFSGHMKAMVQAAYGMLVSAGDHVDVEHVPLSDIRGVCIAARVRNNQLQCRFAWFGKPPLGMKVTPSGLVSSIYHTPFGFDAVARDYRLTSFALNKHSAFESATALMEARKEDIQS